MRSYINYSLLGLSLLGQISTAIPFDSRQKPRSPLPTPNDQPLVVREDGEGPINCYGATDENYILRDKIINIIDNDFCNAAQEQGHPDTDSRSISRKHFTGTINELSITMDWEPGLDFKPNSADCKRIMREITDSCDVKDGRYKGGGEKYVGNVKYQWRPEAKRTSWAGCEYASSGFGHDLFMVWGSGWLGDKVDRLRKRIEGVGLISPSWKFSEVDPDLMVDGKEWRATFKTVVWAQNRVERVIEDLIPGFDVACHKVPMEGWGL